MVAVVLAVIYIIIGLMFRSAIIPHLSSVSLTILHLGMFDLFRAH
jgi:hypothetical protein